MADTCIYDVCISSFFHHCYKTETLNNYVYTCLQRKMNITYLQRKVNI